MENMTEYINDRLIESVCTVVPSDETALKEVKQKIGKFLEGLKPEENRIICARFGLGAEKSSTLEGLSNELNITREKVRQIENKIIKKLQAEINK